MAYKSKKDPDKFGDGNAYMRRENSGSGMVSYGYNKTSTPVGSYRKTSTPNGSYNKTSTPVGNYNKTSTPVNSEKNRKRKAR